jgi:hypothetical protein
MTVRPMSRSSWGRLNSRNRAPDWALSLVLKVLRDEVLRVKPPRLAFFDGDGSYGGRWFPHEYAIGVYRVGDRRLEKVVLLHEMSHFLMSLEGNFPGRHTAEFYRLASRIYVKNRADSDIVNMVERRQMGDS